MPVVVQAAVDLVEGILVATLHGADLGGFEIAGIGPSLVPGSFPEEFVGFGDFAQILERQRKIVDGFAIVGIGIAALRELHGLAQILFGLGETALADVPKTKGIEAADVVGIATQGFLVVVGCQPRGVTILLEVLTGEEKLLVGLDLLGQQGSFGRIGDRTDLVGLGMPGEDGALTIDEVLLNLKGQLVEGGSVGLDRTDKHLFGRKGEFLIEEHLAFVAAQDDPYLLSAGGEDLELDLSPTDLVDVEHQVLRCLLDHTKLAIGHEVLGEHLLFVGHQPGEVGLVLGIDTCHQLDVGTESRAVDAPLLHLLGGSLVGEVAVPGSAEVAIAPGPLLLAGREVMTGHVEHTAVGVVLVAAFEVEARVDAHVAGGDEDVPVVGDIDACRIVHLVIGACGDGERRDGTLAMVEHGVDVGREHALILVVDLNGGIGPPEEGLRYVGAVVEATLDLEIGASGTQREACHTLLMEHLLHLAHPHADRPVGILLDARIDGHIGSGTMVLGPVEFDASRDPWTSKTDEGGLDDVVVIDEVTTGNLVVGHLHTTAQFGQDHHLDVLVLHPDGLVLLIDLLVAHRFDDGIGIDHTTRALIDSLLEEHRVLFGLAHLIGRNRYQFSPSFYHNDILLK